MENSADQTISVQGEIDSRHPRSGPDKGLTKAFCPFTFTDAVELRLFAVPNPCNELKE